MLQHALKEENSLSAFEAADAHIERVKNILAQNENAGASIAPVKEIFPAKNKVIWLAASVILVVAIMFLYQHRQKSNQGIDNIAVHKDSAANKKDTAIVQTPIRADTPVVIAAADAGMLYREFYKRYNGKDDPVEVSIYLLAYYEKNYDTIINAVESDYQVRSSNPSQTPIIYAIIQGALLYGTSTVCKGHCYV